MTLRAFVSTVSDELKEFREFLSGQIVEKTDFKVRCQDRNLVRLDELSLELLDEAIRECACVVHVVGKRGGGQPKLESLEWLRNRHGNKMKEDYPQLLPFLSPDTTLTYTQWEAWLAKLNGKTLLVMGALWVPGKMEDSQTKHLERLREISIYPDNYSSWHDLWKGLHQKLLKLSNEFLYQAHLSVDNYLQRKTKGFVGREWLFRHIDEWADDREKKRLPLLLQGGYGFGKTAVMARLLDRWRNRFLAYHFCIHNSNDTLLPGPLVRSLSAQFGKLFPEYGSVIESAPKLQALLTEADTNPETALIRAVLGPLTELDVVATEKGFQCFIVIDGLDESLHIKIRDDPTGTTLIDLLVTATNHLPSCLKMVVSSRPIPWRLDAGHFEILDFEQDEDDKNANLGDIVKYVVQRSAKDAKIKAFLQREGKTGDELASKLTAGVERRIMFAQYVLNDISQGRIKPGQFDNLPVRMDKFYADTFRWRVENRLSENDKKITVGLAQLKAVLGVISVARDALPITAIAAVTYLGIPEVQLIYDSFGGLLVTDTEQGITFSHISLKSWLDPKGNGGHRPRHGYEIDSEEAQGMLLRHVKSCVKKRLDEVNDFRFYLERHGISMLVEQYEFGDALRLLYSLRAHERGELKPKYLVGLQLLEQENFLIGRLKQRWREVDAETGEARNKLMEALNLTEADHLHDVLLKKVYQTGKYEPVIRTLVECHGDTWQGKLDNLLAVDDVNDIVFRHDVGAVYAQSWRWSPDQRKKAVLDELLTMAQNYNDPWRREIAGYGFKYICERRDKYNWWGKILPIVQKQVERFAHSKDPTDRMVAGEVLLALALHAEPVTGWFIDNPEHARFWNPIWPNNLADINAIRVALATDGNLPQEPSAPEPESLARCKALADYADKLSERLKHCAFFSSDECKRFYPILNGFDSMQDNSEHHDGVAVGQLVQALKGSYKKDVLNFIKLHMLHPAWNVIERGSTLVADIVSQDSKLSYIFDTLNNVPKEHWRIRYGAVDAAFNYGDKDNYQAFFKMLFKFGHDKSCRVRGICIDDLHGWMRNRDTTDRMVEEMFAQKPMVKLIRDWLTTADDIWLLEYLHLLFQELDKKRNWKPRQIEKLMGAPSLKLSRFMGDHQFYRLEPDDFLERAEKIRLDEEGGAAS